MRFSRKDSYMSGMLLPVDNTSGYIVMVFQLDDPDGEQTEIKVWAANIA